MLKTENGIKGVFSPYCRSMPMLQDGIEIDTKFEIAFQIKRCNQYKLPK